MRYGVLREETRMSAKYHTLSSGVARLPLGWVIAFLLAMMPGMPGDSSRVQAARGLFQDVVQQIAVTTTADIVDGNTANFTTLASQPGNDQAISLREALLAANATLPVTLPLTITFNLPLTDPGYDNSTDTWMIEVGSLSGEALPSLSRGNLLLDGNSQATGERPRIMLDGMAVYEADGYNNGLTITSSNNVIRGLIISNFYDNAVVFEGPNSAFNQVANSYIGTDALGMHPQIYGWRNILLHAGAHDNLIGGSSAERNLIVGAQFDGIAIIGPTTTRNVVASNWIGLDKTGRLPLNTHIAAGIDIKDGAHHNTIGGINRGNVIVGNLYGILLSNSSANSVLGNLIGMPAVSGSTLDPTLGNFIGIMIEQGAHDNMIGGTTPGARNVISNNGVNSPYGQGIYIYDPNSTNNIIQGNYIGVDSSGVAPAGNRAHGILLGNQANGNTIGGTDPGAGNVIGYNGQAGIYIDTQANMVAGNLVGVGTDLFAKLPNQRSGIHVNGTNNIIGPNNLIANNMLSGIQVKGFNTTIISNTLQSNERSGICVTGSNTRIHNNRITYNGGIDINSPECKIQGGVVITGTTRSEIFNNTIQNNAGAGVTVLAGSEHSIISNSISQNAMVGILLSNGANEHIAAPRITQASSNKVLGQTCANCLVELFSDDDDEGHTLITSTTALSTGVFSVTFDFDTIDLPYITATATDLHGNTSPFATPVLIGKAQASENRRVLLPMVQFVPDVPPRPITPTQLPIQIRPH